MTRAPSQPGSPGSPTHDDDDVVRYSTVRNDAILLGLFQYGKLDSLSPRYASGIGAVGLTRRILSKRRRRSSGDFASAKRLRRYFSLRLRT